MDEMVREFLQEHRTTAQWLDDIIEVLLRLNGAAHVRTIARHLARPDLKDIDTVEHNVEKRINDFCSDAEGFDKSKEHDLFERVQPATYKLRSYPDKPNTIELIRIEFDDSTIRAMWQSFVQVGRKQNPMQWRVATNEKKLIAFVRWMFKTNVAAEYERRKSVKSLRFGCDFLDALLSNRGRNTL